MDSTGRASLRKGVNEALTHFEPNHSRAFSSDNVYGCLNPNFITEAPPLLAGHRLIFLNAYRMYDAGNAGLAEVESNWQNALATPDCYLMWLGTGHRGLNWHIESGSGY